MILRLVVLMPCERSLNWTRHIGRLSKRLRTSQARLPQIPFIRAVVLSVRHMLFTSGYNLLTRTANRMHPTATRLVRVVPRNLLNVAEEKILARPKHQAQQRIQPTLIDIMMKQKETAGESWPANLRLERQLKREMFTGVTPSLRSVLKKMTKER